MRNNMILIIILIIFVSGCSYTQLIDKTSPQKTVVPYNEVETKMNGKWNSGVVFYDGEGAYYYSDPRDYSYGSG